MKAVILSQHHTQNTTTMWLSSLYPPLGVLWLRQWIELYIKRI